MGAQMRVLKLGRIPVQVLVIAETLCILLCALCEPMDRYLNCWGPLAQTQISRWYTFFCTFIGTPVHGFLVLSCFLGAGKVDTFASGHARLRFVTQGLSCLVCVLHSAGAVFCAVQIASMSTEEGFSAGPHNALNP